MIHLLAKLLQQEPLPTTIETSDPNQWGDLLATFGPFAPFAIFCLTVIKVLWSQNGKKDEEIKRLTDVMITDTVKLVLEGTQALKEANEMVKTSRASSDRLEPLASELLERMDEVIDLLPPKPARRKRTGT